MSPKNGKSSRASTIVIALFSLVFCAISLTAALQKSPTFDEAIHLYAGYSYLKWGDFRINPEHPPLAKMLAALPLIAADLNTSGINQKDRDLVQRNKNYGWGLANRFIYSDNDAEALFFYARIVMISLAMTLGICVFLWAREFYGFEAAVAALFLYCLDPNIIAHASIVQTDIPFALFFFASIYFFWRVLNELNWFNLLTASAFFALAAITKFSFIAILPIWIVLGSVKLLTAVPIMSYITSPRMVIGMGKKSILLINVLLFAILAGYLLVWAAYEFRFDAVPLQRGQLPVVTLSANDAWLQSLVRFSREHFLLPEAWLFGISATYSSIERSAYLLGEISSTGFWAYFPVAFLVKTPAPTVLLLFASLGFTLLSRTSLKDAQFLLIPAGLFFLVAVVSRMNLGLRHILPIYPFLFVWLGGTVASMWRSGQRAWKYGIIGCAVWVVGSSVITYPNYLAFFNEFAGGPNRAHEILVDSNLDWGQDLKGLKKWMDLNGIEKIQLAYFGTAEPSYYHLDAIYLPGTMSASSPPISSLAPEPPYVAISVTNLAGLYLENRDTYAQFRRLKPVAIIGGSIRVYKLKD